MASAFVSYYRHSETIVRSLIEDIEALGHDVWFDQELSGGQVWWDQILERIRRCEIFVFAMAPSALESLACMREADYADSLGKPVLPMLIADGLSASLLPPALSRIQFVDYRTQDRGTALSLARAISNLPPAKPLPDPLPKPPEAPISILTTLAERVGTTSLLDYQEQIGLVIDLKRATRDPETNDDGRTLLERLRRRDDLFAKVAEEIDEVMKAPAEQFLAERSSPFVHNFGGESENSAPKRDGGPWQHEKEERNVKPTVGLVESNNKPKSYRFEAAITGCVLGVALGVIALQNGPRAPESVELIVGCLITGSTGALAGVIAGKCKLPIILALLGTALAWIIVAGINSGHREAFVMGGLLGAPVGAIFGAIAGTLISSRGEQPTLRDDDFRPS